MHISFFSTDFLHMIKTCLFWPIDIVSISHALMSKFGFCRMCFHALHCFLFQQKLKFCFWLPYLGTKYDLDFKSPNKSGQNFKSGEHMIDLYKELCNGTSFSFLRFIILILFLTKIIF